MKECSPLVSRKKSWSNVRLALCVARQPLAPTLVHKRSHLTQNQTCPSHRQFNNRQPTPSTGWHCLASCVLLFICLSYHLQSLSIHRQNLGHVIFSLPLNQNNTQQSHSTSAILEDLVKDPLISAHAVHCIYLLASVHSQSKWQLQKSSTLRLILRTRARVD